MRNILCFFVSALSILTAASGAFAYTIPKDDSRVDYFTVFGAEVSPQDGVEPENLTQVIYFDVPKSQDELITIDVFDPDTGGRLDQKESKDKSWDTIIDFAVYGKEGSLLEKETFGESAEFDMKYYRFGPFRKEMGEELDKFFRFKLVAAPLKTVILKSKELNLFSVRVHPEDVEAFAEKVSFRLAQKKGDKMYFYPEVAAGITEIVVENYDLDPDGATGLLYDPLTQKDYKLNDSQSASWADTALKIDAFNLSRRLVYIITKKTQKFGNVSLRVKDSKAGALPIYFSEAKRKSVGSKKVPSYKPAPATKKAKIEKTEIHQSVVKKKEVKKTVLKIYPLPPKEAGLPCNKFTFDGTASYDQNNQKLSFLWDFGDGATGTDPIVTHIYEKAGEYKVTLNVKDTSGLECDTSATTQVVSVNTQPQPLFSSPDTACVNEEVVFDAGATTDDTPENLTYRWDFADGTMAEGKQATKKFEKGGIYKVRLTVNDNAGTVCSSASIGKDIFINTPPQAQAGSDINMCIPSNMKYAVVFDAGRSRDMDRDALSYSWDFGDGESGRGKVVTHVYKKGGTCTAKLTVNDGRALSCSTSEDTVTVTLNKQPVAVAGPNFVCCIDVDSTFDGSSSYDADGDILNYHWDFGDGASAEGAKVTHRYVKGGQYIITLKVDDSTGTECGSSQTSFKAQVNDQPVSVIKVK